MNYGGRVWGQRALGFRTIGGRVIQRACGSCLWSPPTPIAAASRVLNCRFVQRGTTIAGKAGWGMGIGVKIAVASLSFKCGTNCFELCYKFSQCESEVSMNFHPNAHLESIEGTVKWFDARRGYGFITGPEGQDIMVHFSVIDGDGFRVLKDGAPVLYSAVKTERGWKASRAQSMAEITIAAGLKKTYSRTMRR